MEKVLWRLYSKPGGSVGTYLTKKRKPPCCGGFFRFRLIVDLQRLASLAF